MTIPITAPGTARAQRRDVIWQDLRYALRGIRNRPGFAAAVILTLALGIGANAAMFSVVDRLLFRPPPMLRDPALVHRIYLVRHSRQGEFSGSGVQVARYLDLTNWTTSFARTAIFSEVSRAIGVGADSREMQVGVVSAGFFGFFDAAPAAGRYFTTAEDAPPSGTPVAVLGYGFWQTHYGGRREVIGQTLQIGATLYTIIGVAPRGFAGLWPGQPPAVFIPVAVSAAEQSTGIRLRSETWWDTYHWTWASMIAARKPGVSLEAANADLTAAYLRSYAKQADRDHGMTPAAIARPHAIAASVLSDRGPNVSSVAKVATWISGVALVVWLIACANVANLLLTRALRRRREIAVRLALGVSRARLGSQLLVESVVLAVLGGVAGVLVAQWGGAILRRELLPGTAGAAVVNDPRTLLFGAIAALVAGLLTGLAPLLQARHADLTSDLKAGVREGLPHRSRTSVALLILQGALSVVLLVGAGLFVRSLRNVREVPLGYDADAVVSVELQMRGVVLDSAGRVTLRNRLLDEAKTVPGVSHAALRITMPFWSSWSTDLHVAGIDSVQRLGEFYLNAVSPDYFATMGTRVLRGRGITNEDVAGAPRAMVVSQAMAKTLWPGRDALGQCVRVGGDTVPCTTVVGIAENIRSQTLSAEDGLFYYLPAAQVNPDRGGLFVRVEGDAARAKETLRRRLQPLMPGASYVTVTPLAEILGSQTQSWRLGATSFTVFGGLALVLAAIGLYSVIAYNVAQRTHELGVRVALGAEMHDLVRLVLAEGMKLAVIGVVLGGAIALLVGRWVKPLLFDVSPRDPAVFAGVGAVLLGVAVLASLIPARRAGRVDPIEALRAE
ncbi:MAG TPA: ABC transporter permease [Gemmatimonadales bacterium]|jgi:predicted permease|nr:ABC transporter permease [Gemmatimonadales bacterium]